MSRERDLEEYQWLWNLWAVIHERVSDDVLMKGGDYLNGWHMDHQTRISSFVGERMGILEERNESKEST